MSNTNSVRKIHKILSSNKKYHSIYEISKISKLNSKSVKDCLELLKYLDKIEMATNGHTTLSRLKGAKR